MSTASITGRPKSRLKSFKILWHEGSGRFDGKVFTTWADANVALKSIAHEHSKTTPVGYTKVKVQIDWENGHQIVDRLDISKSCYWPMNETVGQYLQRQNAVMYASTLNVGDSCDLSWSDNDQEPSESRLRYLIDRQAKTYIWN